MNDRLHLRKLRIHCILGVYPEERTQEREIIVNVELGVDTVPAAQRDDLAYTLNYEHIENDLIRVAREGKYKLLEALAEAMTSVCLKYSRVRSVHLTIDKPGALPHTESVAVEIIRIRP